MTRKKMTWIVAIVTVVVLAPILYFASLSRSAVRPNNLGASNGKLRSCPTSPNCVCSQSDAKDTEHYIEAFQLPGEPKAVMERLATVIESMPRTQIVTRDDNYMHAEFTSFLFRFVDDVEFFADPRSGKLHVRSASRVGYSDLGVNRKRVEEIRSRFEAK